MCVCVCLQEYAGDGLRTLAVAYRDLSEEQWEEWSEHFRGADKATDCRDDRLAAAYEEIEQDMMVCLCVQFLLFCLLSLFVNNMNY